jgi:autotransporter-associated beta strand protein
VALSNGSVIGNPYRAGYNSDAVYTVAGNSGSTIAAGLMLVNNVDQTGVRQITFNVADGAADADLTVSGVVSDLTAPVLRGTKLLKAGAGKMVLTSANTYNGATTITGGTLALTGSGSINASSRVTLNGGTLLNNSSTVFSAPITLTQGTVQGTGTFGVPLDFENHDILAPGASPGILTVSGADVTWGPGAAYQWQLYDNNLAAGAGWDLLDVLTSGSGGHLLVSASSASPFVIQLQTLSDPTTPGAPQNWQPMGDYTWQIAHADAGVTGFDRTKFAFDTSGFAGLTGVFSMSLSADSKDLLLNYEYVPEPGTLALMGLGAIGLMLLRRRRKPAC